MWNLIYHKGWRDERLKWNLTEFGNITEIYLNPHDVWTPNIEIVNLARQIRDQSEYEFSASKILRIENTGEVYWTQLLRPILFCEMQLYTYPIGHQICSLKLASVGRGKIIISI